MVATRTCTADDFSLLRCDWLPMVDAGAKILEMECGDAVFSAVISHDSSRIVSGDGSGKVTVWEALTGAKLHEMQCGGSVRAAISPCGTRIAGGDNASEVTNGEVKSKVTVWDARTGAKLREMECDGKGFTTGMTCLAFSHDGSVIVSGDSRRKDEEHTGKLTLWATSRWAPILQNWECGAGAGGVCDVAFSPDGVRIVSGDAARKVIIWDFYTGNKLRVMECGDSVRGVALYCKGAHERIASGDLSGKVTIWDALSGDKGSSCDKLHDMQCGGPVHSVAFSTDAARVVSGDESGKVTVWDASTGTKMCEMECGGPVLSVAFTRDGTRVVSGDGSKKVTVWSVVDLGVLT